MADDHYPADDALPSVWRDVSSGTAGTGVRLAVSVLLAAGMAGLALILSYGMAATWTSWDQYGGSASGVYPSDELLLFVFGTASIAYLAAAAWVWTRGRRNRAPVYTAVLSVVIIGGTILLAVLAEQTFEGEDELLIGGVVCLGLAGLLMLWLNAFRKIARGSPSHNPRDGRLDVRCPACDYRMVGLHESRCPECGAAYTLDELLARQQFSRLAPPASATNRSPATTTSASNSLPPLPPVPSGPQPTVVRE